MCCVLCVGYGFWWDHLAKPSGGGRFKKYKKFCFGRNNFGFFFFLKKKLYIKRYHEGIKSTAGRNPTKNDNIVSVCLCCIWHVRAIHNGASISLIFLLQFRVLGLSKFGTVRVWQFKKKENTTKNLSEPDRRIELGKWLDFLGIEIIIVSFHREESDSVQWLLCCFIFFIFRPICGLFHLWNVFITISPGHNIIRSL